MPVDDGPEAPRARRGLIESLDLEVDEAVEVEAAWSAEIARRLERVDAGVAKMIPWSEARRRFITSSLRQWYC
jgi:hypothetical protein